MSKRSQALCGFLFLATTLASCSGSPSPSPLISINPASANVSIGQHQLFQVYMDGNVVTSPFSWQVNAVTGGNPTAGTISAFGFYTAPDAVPSPANVTVTAIAQADPAESVTAMVTVGPLISISPPSPTILTYGTQQFFASVTGTSDTAVTWQISCNQGGSACGAISQTGLYQAPNSVPTTASGNGSATAPVTITAVSQASPAFSGSVVAGISSLNQQPQGAPIQLGTSGSNINSTCIQANVESCFAATLGALLTRGGTQYILSNSHVFTSTSMGGTVGDAIVQPGLLDTSPAQCDATKVSTVANLSQFTNPQTDTGAKVDAAIAQVVSGAVDPSGAIEELGATVVNGVPQPGTPAQGNGIVASVNELVAKSGRSTGVTCANVEAVGVSVRIQYQSFCSATTFTVSFSNQVAIGAGGFSAGGDSGSLIVDANTAQPVALLFAGDSTATSLGNPVGDVLNALKDSNNNIPSFVGGAPHTVAACSLPPPTAAATLDGKMTVPAEAIGIAEEVRNRRASELLANPAVAVGIGASLDVPTEPAILLFVQNGGAGSSIPAEIEGIRMRRIEVNRLDFRGLLNLEQSNQLASHADSKQTSALPDSELKGAMAVKEKYVAQWMADPAVQGVGVGSSLDSPGDLALLFYLLQGMPHIPIPATVDGFRTRIKETSGFHAGISDIRGGHYCRSPLGAKGSTGGATH